MSTFLVLGSSWRIELIGELPFSLQSDTELLAASSDGIRLAAISEKGPIVIWNLQEARLEQAMSLPMGYNWRAMCFSAEKALFAAYGRFYPANPPFSDMESIYVINSQSSVQFTLEGHSITASSVAFSPDATKLFVCDRTGIHFLWNPLDGQLLQRSSTHDEPLTPPHLYYAVSAAFSPDGQTLALCQGNQRQILNFWSLKPLTLVHMLRLPSQMILASVVFVEDGTMLACHCVESHPGRTNIDVLFLYDYPSLRLVAEVRLPATEAQRDFTDFASMLDGTVLVLSTFEGKVWIWHKPSQTFVATIQAHPHFQALGEREGYAQFSNLSRIVAIPGTNMFATAGYVSGNPQVKFSIKLWRLVAP